MRITKNQLLYLFILCLIYVFSKKLYLDSIPEVLAYGSEIGSILYDFALAYTGGYIFYWIASYETTHDQKELNKIANGKSLEGLLFSLEDLIIFSIHILGKSDRLESNFDIDESKINIETDSLQIGIDENIKGSFIEIDGTPVQLQYFQGLSKLSDKFKERNSEILKNVYLLPKNLLLILIELDNNDIGNMVRSKITLNRIMQQRYQNTYSITPKDSRDFINNVLNLISVYKKLKYIYETDFGCKLQKRDLIQIHIDNGTMSDKFSKWK